MPLFIIVILALAQAASGSLLTYGTGRDGNVVIAEGEVDFSGAIGVLMQDVDAANESDAVWYRHERGEPFAVGDEVVMHAGSGAIAGSYQFFRVLETAGSGGLTLLVLDRAIVHDFEADRTRICRVIEAVDFIIEEGATYQTPRGAPMMLVIRAQNSIQVRGTLSGSGRTLLTDEGWRVIPPAEDQGPGPGAFGSSSSGAGHAGPGGRGGGSNVIYFNGSISSLPAVGGLAYGMPGELSRVYTGSHGGSSYQEGFTLPGPWAVGGAGASIIVLSAPAITIEGPCLANGESGLDAGPDGPADCGAVTGPGGGGSGGTVILNANTISGSGIVRVAGGRGGGGYFSNRCESTTVYEVLIGNAGSGALGRAVLRGNSVSRDLVITAGSVTIGTTQQETEAGGWLLY